MKRKWEKGGGDGGGGGEILVVSTIVTPPTKGGAPNATKELAISRHLIRMRGIPTVTDDLKADVRPLAVD